MKKNKVDGKDELMSDHFISGTHMLQLFVSLLFTGILSHGMSPDDIVFSGGHRRQFWRRGTCGARRTAVFTGDGERRQTSRKWAPKTQAPYDGRQKIIARRHRRRLRAGACRRRRRRLRRLRKAFVFRIFKLVTELPVLPHTHTQRIIN